MIAADLPEKCYSDAALHYSGRGERTEKLRNKRAVNLKGQWPSITTV